VSRDWSKRIAATRPEARLLLACAHASLDAERVRQLRMIAQDHLDWDWLLARARPHGVAPLLRRHLSSSCLTAAPPHVLATLAARDRTDARRALRLTAELLRLLDLLAAHGIPAVPLKGPAVAAVLYGDVSLRPFRDLDLLVREADVPGALALLGDQGYRRQETFTPPQEAAVLRATRHHFLARPDGDIVELHWALGPDDLGFPQDLEDLWARLAPVCVGGREVPALAPADLLLFLCAHGAKHLWQRLGWIADVAELVRRAELDYDALAARARAAGGGRVLRLGLFLAWDLLDAPIPAWLARSLAAHRSVTALGETVRRRLFADSPSDPSGFELLRFHIRVRERLRDRVRGAVRAVATPGVGDWALVRLPDSLYPLYYLVRPFRLAAKYARSI